jgi:uncharacterized membrane protein YgaE (UPF0421/DUF939 family)
MNFTATDSGNKIKEISQSAVFLANSSYNDSMFEINQLENEKLQLKQLIAQLRHDNHLLRKKLFSTGKIEISKDKCA